MLKTIRTILFTVTKAAVFFGMVLMLSACSGLDGIVQELQEELHGTKSTMEEPKDESTTVSEPKPAVKVETESTFTKSSIPPEIQKKMDGVTISDSSILSFDDLSYLTLSYYGYDGKTHVGHLVVDKTLADEVIGIFQELYQEKFPIERMKLPCEYGGVDELSMRDNNTSAYNDRPIEGNGAISYHQKGRAIDINPLVNPYIRFSDGEVLPTTARQYLDRNTYVKGMIQEDSVCVRIFKKYGWDWGGDWNSVKDYQHFEKK